MMTGIAVLGGIVLTFGLGPSLVIGLRNAPWCPEWIKPVLGKSRKPG